MLALLVATFEFVIQEQGEELGGCQALFRGLLRAHIEGQDQAGKLQLAQFG
jgi:hypothetical protein